MEYHGYWFYDLQNDKIIQAKDLTEEYCLLNCPQSIDGPFKEERDVKKYIEQHPNLSKEFNESLQKYLECCNREIIDDEKFWDNYIQEVGYDNLY